MLADPHPKPLVLGIIAFLALFSYMGTAETRTQDDPDLLPVAPYSFGMSTALNGPTADLGRNMQEGILAAFDEVNRAGGVDGHEFSLLALDDGYEPKRTVPNMRQLLAAGVLAVVGNVGTPTAIVSVPIANESKTLMFGAFTGAGVLRKDPPDRYVINYRASYAEETAAMVDALIEHGGLKPEEIAFFTQRDGYGDAGYSGGVAALSRHGLEREYRIAHGRYERNTIAVENGLADILLAKTTPRAVIMVCAYAPCARFIEQAREFGLDAVFLNVSFVGTTSVARKLGSIGDGMIITQVVPHPGGDLPFIAHYRKTVGRGAPGWKPTFGSLEGYVVGRILIRAVKESRGECNRESLVEAFNCLGDFDLGLGAPLHLGPNEHQASHTVWPMILEGGQAVPMEWSEVAGLLVAK